MLMSRGTHTSQTEIEMEKVTGLIQGFLQASAPLGGLEVAASHGEPESVALEYLKRHDRPQAIFAHSDTIAFGVIRACAKLGLSIPRDVQLISSGGMGLAAIAQSPLTALTLPAEAIGREAANMLRAMIEDNIIRIERRRVPGSLVIRESCPISDDACEELRRLYPDFDISRAT
jgi:DNA-binding LacI/PurR family transcriptional regulator